ncbi:MAG: hypothetical protein AAF224_03640 [Pseudomonadota bacterium]
MSVKNQKSNNLWTFVVDYDSGTFLSQFFDETLSGAIEQYNAADPSERNATPINDDTVRITGLKNVWCVTGLSESDRLITAHIIRTET